MKHGKQITHNCSTVSAWCSDDSFPLYYHLEVIHRSILPVHRDKLHHDLQGQFLSPCVFFTHENPASSMSFVGSIPEFSRKCLKRTLDRERLLIRHCVQVVTASVPGSIAVRRVKLF